MRVFIGDFTKDQKLADLHIHTNKSNGVISPKQVVELATESKLLNTIAITDYNSIKPAIEAKNYCSKTESNLNVVIGAEITTTEGHILGLYLQKDAPKNKSLEETILEVHKQQALVIIPHPFHNEVSLSVGSLKKIMESKNKDLYFDGFEIFNAATNKDSERSLVKNTTIFYLENKATLGAALGVSGTSKFSIGQGLTAYRDDLQNAIKTAQTNVLYLEQEESQNLQIIANQLFQ